MELNRKTLVFLLLSIVAVSPAYSVNRYVYYGGGAWSTIPQFCATSAERKCSSGGTSSYSCSSYGDKWCSCINGYGSVSKVSDPYYGYSQGGGAQVGTQEQLCATKTGNTFVVTVGPGGFASLNYCAGGCVAETLGGDNSTSEDITVIATYNGDACGCGADDGGGYQSPIGGAPSPGSETDPVPINPAPDGGNDGDGGNGGDGDGGNGGDGDDGNGGDGDDGNGGDGDDGDGDDGDDDDDDDPDYECEDYIDVEYSISAELCEAVEIYSPPTIFDQCTDATGWKYNYSGKTINEDTGTATFNWGIANTLEPFQLPITFQTYDKQVAYISGLCSGNSDSEDPEDPEDIIDAIEKASIDIRESISKQTSDINTARASDIGILANKNIEVGNSISTAVSVGASDTSAAVASAAESLSTSISDSTNEIVEAINSTAIGGEESYAAGGASCDSEPVCNGDAVACATYIETWAIRCQGDSTLAYGNSEASDNCNAEPICELDDSVGQFECASLKQEWITMCKMLEPYDGNAVAVAMGGVADLKVKDLKAGEVDLSLESYIFDSGGGIFQCNIDEEVNVMGVTIPIPFTVMCELFFILSNFFLLGGYWHSLKIIMGLKV